MNRSRPSTNATSVLILLTMTSRLISCLVAWFVASLCVTTARGQMLINGAGSTFDYPVLSKWFDVYSKIDTSVQFNYQSIGSGGGLRQLMAQTVDFGASDAPMTDAALAEASGKILHFPIVAGGLGIVYHLPGDPKLKLDSEAIAGLFLGTISKWNDPKIAAQNPGLSLPDMDVVVVHRSDGSGTTFIFTDYLTTVNPAWASKVGKNTSVKWPAGVGAKGNEGVAGQVRQLDGAVGYVELAYAVQNHMVFADLKNAAGNYVRSTSIVSAQPWPPQDSRRLPLFNGELARREGIPHFRRELDSHLPAAKGLGARQEAGRIPQVGHHRRPKALHHAQLRSTPRQSGATRTVPTGRVEALNALDGHVSQGNR